MAAGTSRNKHRRLGQRLGRLPVQQRADALEPFPGRGAEPAEVADALEAFGQDVLEEAMNELLGGKRQRLLFSGVVFVGEGDV